MDFEKMMAQMKDMPGMPGGGAAEGLGDDDEDDMPPFVFASTILESCLLSELTDCDCDRLEDATSTAAEGAKEEASEEKA